MHVAPRIVTTVAVGLLPIIAVAQAPEEAAANSRVLWVGLANGTEGEALMATELRSLARKYDVEPWVLTRSVLIDENQIPHSHPILTIHTRHIGEELELLSTFVHEQLHWLEEDPWLADFQAAMKDLEALFPDVPSSAGGGARDDESTYRHLLVCDLEYQAMASLVGEATARETLAAITHYQWIYDKVLSDPRVREVALRHGFNVSDGVPRHE
jgi:hypothetical protein